MRSVHFYAGYTLCTNLDKSGTNHEAHIAYTQVILVRFLPDLIRDSRFVNSQPLAVLHEPLMDTNSICTDFSAMRLSLYTVPAFWRIFSLFCKFLNSSRLINYQLIGLWLCVMVRRWMRESWIWRIHELCIESSSWRFAFHNLFVQMVHKFQIRANHAQCIAGIRMKVEVMQFQFFIENPNSKCLLSKTRPRKTLHRPCIHHFFFKFKIRRYWVARKS